MRAHSLFFVLVFLLLNSPPLAADMSPLPKIRVGIPPTEVLKEIIRTNPLPAKMEKKDVPLITWLTEPDERLSPAMFLTDSINRVYTVSCPAAQLLPAAASIDFGVRELLTPVLLIAYSSESRFVKLFLAGYGEQRQEMRQILDHLHLPLNAETGGAMQKPPKTEAALLTAIEKNIDFQVREAMVRYGDRIAGGRLLVAGGVIDLDNAYGHGRNRLVLININGETDPQKMRLMREVATIGQESASLLGRTRPMATQEPKSPMNPTKMRSKPAAGK